jgi:hypothetical protein
MRRAKLGWERAEVTLRLGLRMARGRFVRPPSRPGAVTRDRQASRGASVVSARGVVPVPQVDESLPFPWACSQHGRSAGDRIPVISRCPVGVYPNFFLS